MKIKHILLILANFFGFNSIADLILIDEFQRNETANLKSFNYNDFIVSEFLVISADPEIFDNTDLDLNNILSSANWDAKIRKIKITDEKITIISDTPVLKTNLPDDLIKNISSSANWVVEAKK